MIEVVVKVILSCLTFEGFCKSLQSRFCYTVYHLHYKYILCFSPSVACPSSPNLDMGWHISSLLTDTENANINYKFLTSMRVKCKIRPILVIILSVEFEVIELSSIINNI